MNTNSIATVIALLICFTYANPVPVLNVTVSAKGLDANATLAPVPTALLSPADTPATNATAPASNSTTVDVDPENHTGTTELPTTKPPPPTSTTTLATTTTKPTTTSTVAPSTTTPKSTTAVPITTPSTPSPAPPVTTTGKPSPHPTEPHKPTGAPTPSPHGDDRKFDGPSFIGGIILACGLTAIGFIAFKFYKARTEHNYHTL